jgi:putative transposase
MPLGLAVDGAQRHDMKLFLQTLVSLPIPRPEPDEAHPQHVCLDAGYDYDAIYEQAVELGLIPHISPSKGTCGNAGNKARRQAKKDGEGETAGRRARRWVVERLHSWLNRYRHLLVRWAKKLENYVAMLHLAFAHILFKQTTHHQVR